MIAFERILCPIDFSDTSLGALACAAAFASWFDARLDVLHVVPALETGPEARASHDAIVSQIDRAIAAAGAAAVPASALVQEGDAYETIVGCARAQRADLLVMGTHGRSGVSRLLLGSVTEKLVRTASCPVLTVPPAASSIDAAPIALRRILCPTDGSPAAGKALQYALDLASKADGRLTVLHALEYMDADEQPEPLPFDPCYQGVAEERRQRQRRIDRARAALQAQVAQASIPGREIEQVVVVDRAYKAILRYAAEGPADLIVMGAQGSGGVELMLYGSNTHHVVRAATCPVLTVRG